MLLRERRYQTKETKVRKWLLSKSLQAINTGEGVEKENPLPLLVGMQTSIAHMENSVEIP